ncbi:PREDICTED: sodium/bile acid cotransporter 4-like, partial [Nanorana parkeri]|uniref:sodium/bile acid cotransporter 4-like n=1 Tax=Nanorana parkeri TaxID=125878 RepID=UPI000854A518
MENSSISTMDLSNSSLWNFGDNFTESSHLEIATTDITGDERTEPNSMAVMLQRALPEQLASSAPFWDSPLNHFLSVFVGVALCVTMLGLGCTVEVSQIGEHLRRPIGVLLALICQFVLMPLVAFLLALIFSLNEVAAIAVLLCGCCPGGNLSNIMSLLVNGDMNLSISLSLSL